MIGMGIEIAIGVVLGFMALWAVWAILSYALAFVGRAFEALSIGIDRVADGLWYAARGLWAGARWLLIAIAGWRKRRGPASRKDPS